MGNGHSREKSSWAADFPHPLLERRRPGVLGYMGSGQTTYRQPGVHGHGMRKALPPRAMMMGGGGMSTAALMGPLGPNGRGHSRAPSARAPPGPFRAGGMRGRGPKVINMETGEILSGRTGGDHQAMMMGGGPARSQRGGIRGSGMIVMNCDTGVIVGRTGMMGGGGIPHGPPPRHGSGTTGQGPSRSHGTRQPHGPGHGPSGTRSSQSRHPVIDPGEIPQATGIRHSGRHGQSGGGGSRRASQHTRRHVGL